MTSLSLMQGFVYGVIGGAVPEFLSLYKIRHDYANNKPAYHSSGIFWLMTLLMILVGGLLVDLYINMDTPITPLLAVHIGASAPTIIGGFTKQIGNKEA